MIERRLIQVWSRTISARVESLLAAIGIVGLLGCFLLPLLLLLLFPGILTMFSHGFDRSFLLWLHQFAHPLLDRMMIFVTNLGHPLVLISVGFGSVMQLWRQRRDQSAKIAAIVYLGGGFLTHALKLAIGRLRPALWTRLTIETAYSFPSGHALGSIVVYGLTAYLLASYDPRASSRIYGLTGSLIALIGFSRLYLGVHWLTDIIAGYLIGLAWLLLGITLLRLQWLSNRLKTSDCDRPRTNLI